MSDGPYKACVTSKDHAPYLYGVDGPGQGLGYYAWYLFPENTFATWEEARKAARLMNLAFEQGGLERSREFRRLLG